MCWNTGCLLRKRHNFGKWFMKILWLIWLTCWTMVCLIVCDYLRVCKDRTTTVQIYEKKKLRISSPSGAFSLILWDNLYYLYLINVFLFLVGCLGFPCPPVLCVYVYVCVEDAGLSIVVVPLAVRLSVGMAAWCLFNLSQCYSITPNPIQCVQSCLCTVYSWCRCVMFLSLYISLFSVFYYLFAISILTALHLIFLLSMLPILLAVAFICCCIYF